MARILTLPRKPVQEPYYILQSYFGKAISKSSLRKWFDTFIANMFSKSINWINRTSELSLRFPKLRLQETELLWDEIYFLEMKSLLSPFFPMGETIQSVNGVLSRIKREYRHRTSWYATLYTQRIVLNYLYTFSYSRVKLYIWRIAQAFQVLHC